MGGCNGKREGERGYNTTERGRVEGGRWAAAAERIKGWRGVINAKSGRGERTAEQSLKGKLKKEGKRGDSRQANRVADRPVALPQCSLVVD